jgi:acyl dehydratase
MAKEVYYKDVNVGTEMPSFTSDPITRTHLVRYAGASGDFNPLHHDNTFTALFGMPNVIAHGMLIMGITGRAITNWIPQKHLKKYKVRFSGMTDPMDLNDAANTTQRATITVKGKVAKKWEEGGDKLIECEIESTDGNGNVKLTGTFVAALP